VLVSMCFANGAAVYSFCWQEIGSRTPGQTNMTEYRLVDFLIQIQKLGRTGELREAMKRIPIMSRDVEDCDDEGIQLEIKCATGIFDSMTPTERLRPEIIDTDRSERIASGSGASRKSVFDLVRQFKSMRNTMAAISNSRY